MTHAQISAIEQYLIDLEGVRDVFQLYTSEDKITGALQLLLDTGEMDNNTYNVWHKRLHDKVNEIERVKGL